jgi:hypothetical protein
LLEERIESIINIRCCFECSERFLGCHSKCNKYIAEKENNEKVQAERHKQAEVNYSIYQIKQQNIIRSVKKLRQL